MIYVHYTAFSFHYYIIYLFDDLLLSYNFSAVHSNVFEQHLELSQVSGNTAVAVAAAVAAAAVGHKAFDHALRTDVAAD